MKRTVVGATARALCTPPRVYISALVWEGAGGAFSSLFQLFAALTSCPRYWGSPADANHLIIHLGRLACQRARACEEPRVWGMRARQRRPIRTSMLLRYSIAMDTPLPSASGCTAAYCKKSRIRITDDSTGTHRLLSRMTLVTATAPTHTHTNVLGVRPYELREHAPARMLRVCARVCLRHAYAHGPPLLSRCNRRRYTNSRSESGQGKSVFQ